MVDNVTVAFLVDHPEFYVLEVSHFQGLLRSIMPERESQDNDVVSYSTYYKNRALNQITGHVCRVMQTYYMIFLSSLTICRNSTLNSTMMLPPTPFPIYLWLAITSPNAVRYQKVIGISQSV